MAQKAQNDLFDLLETDHRKVADMLEKLEGTTTRAVKTRDEIFKKLKEEVDLHAYIEEQIFYPRFEEEKDTRDITLEAYEEHMIVRRLLMEMAELSPDDDVWTAKLSLLKETIEHHVEEEENELFPLVETVCSEDELMELAQQFQDLKAKGMPAGGGVLRGVEKQPHAQQGGRKQGQKGRGEPSAER